MKIKIDFQLNRSFGVVERIIFRLVLNGFTDAKEMVDALPIFSDVVIANAIKHLVNRQILSANVNTGELSLADPLLAIIGMCLDNTFDIDLSFMQNEQNNLPFVFSTSIMAGDKDVRDAVQNIKKAILFELLPNVKLDLYIDSLDFTFVEETR